MTHVGVQRTGRVSYFLCAWSAAPFVNTSCDGDRAIARDGSHVRWIEGFR